MKKVLSAWLAVIMMLQVSFGYTLTVTNGNETIVREVDANTQVMVSLSSREPAEYTVTRGTATLTEVGNRRTFTMPAEDVDISIIPTGGNGGGGEATTATVTYDANGGSFASGTTNALTYEISNTEIKTSKTANVSEDGTTADTTTGYGNSQKITDTVTIEGAEALEVTITYQTEGASYDWVCIYDNSVTPSSSNYASSITGKLGGTTKKTETYTVEGDTVQFYFKSNGLTCNYYGYYAEVQAAPSLTGNYEVPTNSGYELAGWSTSSEATTPEYRGIQDLTTDTTLYAVWKQDIEDAVQVGDYVTYTPNATNCDLTTITGVSQTALNPSGTTQWRVLSNDGTTIELVSAESVGALNLGASSRRSTDGTYSDGSAEAEQLAKDNYAQIGRILREISEAYVDNDITTGGRGLGYKEGSSVEEINTTTYPITWENTYTNGNYGFPYTDSYYSTDVDALKNNNMLHSSGSVWLASRYLATGSSYSGFNVHRMYASGGVSINNLFDEYSDGSADSGVYSDGVRPVVSLTSGLNATGEGTKDYPWVLTNENGGGGEATTFAVTYDANGGSFTSGTTNALTYTLPAGEIKTSKTANVSEDGTTADTTTGYGNSQSITDTVTIEGAEALLVTITYQTESVSYDWVCIYDNSVTPSSSNYASSITGKLGGSTKTTKTYRIEGDTAQFYFKSDSSGCNYYGYYAEVQAAPSLTGSYEVPTNSGYELAGWSTSSGATTPEYRGIQELTTDTTLYAVWKQDIEDAVQVGDYIKYYPNANTVNLTELTGISQTALNTASTEDWRVLSVDTSTGAIELVSANSVGTLKLSESSTRATDGTYTAGSQEIEDQAKTNYVNAIYILNTISEAYEKEGITNGSRGLGYNGTAVEQIDTNTYEISHEATGGNEDFVRGEPYVDSHKSADITALKDKKMLIDSSVWLASRIWGTGADSGGRTDSLFHVRSVYASGGVYYSNLFDEYSDGSAYSFARSNGVRPVVSLTSGLNAEGEGTKDYPWIIN